MASDRSPSRALCALLLTVAVVALGCPAPSLRRFPLRPVMTRDTDLAPVAVACRPDPERPGRRRCMPEPYVSTFGWDGADNMLFRPVSRFLAVDPGGESVNVNALDEVPDSSWFTNRLGARPMTEAEVSSGPCDPRDALDPNAPDGAWEIDRGKPDGANPGFRIRVGRLKFMLKADPPEQPERATGATAIATRIYHAAGWWAPCDAVVYFRPSILRLRPGLTVTDNLGVTRPFDQAALDRVLARASRRGGLIRMVASQWLPGQSLGPFRYEGTRDDDPNDVIPHEDRRDLRGARVIAAWLNHFDAREQNSMDTWMAVNPDDDASPGYVRHWYLDLGDCFGSEWDQDRISRRLGHASYLDLPAVFADLFTLGLIERPWDRARRAREAPIFGYFHARDFNPDTWHPGYPNPAFDRTTEHDAAWAARIVARFTPALVAAAIRAGDYTSPVHVAFLTRQVLDRQRILLRRYLAALSPIADLRVEAGNTLCGVDLARRADVFPGATFRYTARAWVGRGLVPDAAPAVRAEPDGTLCVPLRHHAPDGASDGDASRYTVVELRNGHARGALRAHLYDLGPMRGFQLVGAERPDG